MTGREVVKIAFDLKEPPRIPTTLIAGGSWAIHMAGETFAGVKENPERIADVFVQAFNKVESDFLFLASFMNPKFRQI